MSFLMLKMVALLLLAAVLGAWLARWWMRRNYVEVTTEYRQLSGDWGAWRRSFEDKLAQRPEVDLQPLHTRLGCAGRHRGQHPPAAGHRPEPGAVSGVGHPHPAGAAA